ncbi:MAG: IS630 family transposase [Acidobacteria bacterium]|nr:IS630 family transposase [Acidobacteriota bacterium]
MSPVAQEGLRQRVVHALMGGISQAQAARVFGVSRRSVNGWHRRWREGGLPALRSGPRGRPQVLYLKPYQAATVVRLITDRCPDQLKIPFSLWTREAVRDLIRRKFGIRLSLWTVGRYLRRWGFTPQKPVRRAYERDPAAVRRWLKKQYPAIQGVARREKATIFWGDEMGMRSDHQAGRSWGRRGQTPVIPGTGKRFRSNMISAISNRGKLAFMVFENRFTAVVFVLFMRRLIRHAKRKVFLIVDGHPVHVAAAVKRWVARHRKQIRLFFLPGYSPELNPDELLNQDVKSNAVGRKRPRDKGELLRNVRHYLWSTQRQPDKVQNYFLHPNVHYAAQGEKHLCSP